MTQKYTKDVNSHVKLDGRRQINNVIGVTGSAWCQGKWLMPVGSQVTSADGTWLFKGGPSGRGWRRQRVGRGSWGDSGVQFEMCRCWSCRARRFRVDVWFFVPLFFSASSQPHSVGGLIQSGPCGSKVDGRWPDPLRLWYWCGSFSDRHGMLWLSRDMRAFRGSQESGIPNTMARTANVVMYNHFLDVALASLRPLVFMRRSSQWMTGILEGSLGGSGEWSTLHSHIM